MSGFFHTIASILLSAVIFVAAQTLPTNSINRGRKMERVEEAINEATDFDDAAAAAAEAKPRKTILLPPAFDGRYKIHVPPWRIRAALLSGNMEGLASDIFIGVYTVRCPKSPPGRGPKSQPQPRRAAPPPTTTFADIMRIPSHIPKVKSARLRWLDRLLAAHPEIDGCTEEGRTRLQKIALAAEEARRPAARPSRGGKAPDNPLKPEAASISGKKPFISEMPSQIARITPSQEPSITVFEPSAPEEHDIAPKAPTIPEQPPNVMEEPSVIEEETIPTTEVQSIPEEDVAIQEKSQTPADDNILREDGEAMAEETAAPDFHEPIITGVTDLPEQLLSQELATPEPAVPESSIAEMAAAEAGTEVDLTSKGSEG